jgi:hypothetical protein
VHISLADLLRLEGSSALQEQWTAQVRERWAARRAAASQADSERGAWLDGDAAEAIACDAAMAPIVTGEVNVGALEDLVRLCVELHDRRRDGWDGGRHGGRDAAWATIEDAVIGKAVDLLSGPGRPGQLPAPPAARRPARRAQPAAGHRALPDHPARHPQRRHPARPQMPLDRRLQPARRRV